MPRDGDGSPLKKVKKEPAASKDRSAGKLTRRERRERAREEAGDLDDLAATINGEATPVIREGNRGFRTSPSRSPELIRSPSPSSTSGLTEGAPAWLGGFQATLKADMQQHFSEMRASLSAESRSQHEGLQKQLQDTVKSLRAQSDAKLAAIEARLDALEATYRRHPEDDPMSPRSSEGSRAGGLGYFGGPRHAPGPSRTFDPQDPTFQMVVGGFAVDKRQEIDESLKVLYEDEELKLLVQSHRSDFRDNKAIVHLKVEPGEGFRSLRQKQRAFIARWREIAPKSKATASRDKPLWASQNRTPEERARIRAVVLTVRFLEHLQPRLATDDKQKVELGWRRGEVWVHDKRVL